MSKFQLERTEKGGIITLSMPSIWSASAVGCKRHMEAIKAGLHDYAPKKDNGWTLHIEGAAGELAVAYFLGVKWDGDVNTFKNKPDVLDLEVKTRLEDNWDLIVRHREKPNTIYILLTGKIPTFNIRGWIGDADARQDKWLRNYGGYGEEFFVPQNALHPMSELPGYVNPTDTNNQT